MDCKQTFGAPIGGIGTGSIGRTYTGEFCRFQLVPGLYEHKVAEANMFTVCLRKKSQTVYQQALTVRSSSKLKGFKSWNLGFPGELGSYYVLYPESWTVYSIPNEKITLTCHQLSPIIPHNYKDSSLPVALFNWTIENANDEEIELALMFTWQSGTPSNKFELKDVKSKPFENNSPNGTNLSGVLLSQKLKGMPLEYCVAAVKKVLFLSKDYLNKDLFICLFERNPVKYLTIVNFIQMMKSQAPIFGKIFTKMENSQTKNVI